MVLLVNMAADRRRLQGEIDKTLKKVNEGVEAFDDVWHKLSIVSRAETPNATNMNQKEKYELELKKEIKKLQRLREQIKTWQSSNDIKDKKPLLEARKNIEAQMERFKVIERETKQKPYSKDALGSSYKFDPLDREKEELTNWIQASNSKLSSQIEDLETKLEDLNANKKKRMDKDRIESTKHRMDINKKYIDTLEKISEMLKKNLINVKKVQDIKDDVEYYVDNNDDSNLPENLDGLEIFDDLDLDKYDSTGSNFDNDENENDRDTYNDDDDDDDEDLDNDDTADLHTHHDSRLSQSPTTSSANLSKSNSPTVITTGLNTSISNINYAPSSSSSSSSSSTATGLTLNEEDKRRRHKSEGNQMINSKENGTCNTTNGAASSNGDENATTSNQRSNNRRGAAASNNTNISNRNRTNSGSGGSSSLKEQAATSSDSAANKSLSNSPIASIALATTTVTVTSSIQTQQQQVTVSPNMSSSNSSSSSSSNSTIVNTNTATATLTTLTTLTATPPLSQSPIAAVVAGTATSQPVTPPVSFSAVLSTAKQQQQQKQLSYSSQVKTLSSANTTMTTSANEQQNNLVANEASTNALGNTQTGSPVQVNGQPSSTLESTDDKQPEETPEPVNSANSSVSHLNTLKVMAENAILNQAASVSTNNQMSANGPSQTDNMQIANLLNAAASLQQQQQQQQQQLQQQQLVDQTINDQNNSAAMTAALATLLSQQQQKQLNLPAALSMLQQNVNQSQSQQQQSVSPSLLCQQQFQSNTTNQETFIQPILGVAPLGKTALTKEQNQQLSILEGAYKKLPHPSDTERTRNYLPRVSVNTPAYYPQVPPVGHDSLDFLCKLNSDTLFFMFYYMEGTKAQFLAAQALKKLSWRFHTRYMMWFQRYEEPKVITDEYENGTYVFFDFEKWAQRKKEGFTFEYKYLEDRDLTSFQ